MVWFLGPVAAHCGEANERVLCHSAYDRGATGAYLFDSIDADFDKNLTHQLRDVSYTLVLDRGCGSAKLYLHSAGTIDVLARHPESSLARLAAAVERGEGIDLPFAQSLAGSEDPEVRIGLTEVLSEVAAPSATILLAELLMDSSRSVVIAAVDALVEHGTHEAIHVLGSALLDGRMLQRYAVAEGLSEFEADLARTYLAQARGDVDPRVRGLVDEVLSDPNGG